MNGTRAPFFRLVAALAALVSLGWVLTGQAGRLAPHRVSLVTDWSHRHVIFPHTRSVEREAFLQQDPRYWQQVYRRELPRNSVSARLPGFVHALPVKVHSPHSDWAENLGSTGTAGAGNYPAKYSFDITTPHCVTDYVVYSTGLAGAPGPGPGGQADIVAFNNLYNGCSGLGPVPSVYWAYNTSGGTSGTVKTSPVISLDGSQVAFVQTDGVSAATLVILTWATPSGTINNPIAPPSLPNGSYRGCTAPCMTTIPLMHGITPLNDTTSSIFYDYKNDVAWVGGTFGWLHKIMGVFNGTPTELIDGTFPVQVNASTWISSPVYDRISGRVFVGDDGGFLYAVDATTGAVTQSGQLAVGTGLTTGPLVDSANGFVYVFSASDGTSAAVYQLSTMFGAGTPGTEVTVGNGGTTNPMFLGGFDSEYYTSGTATGNLYVCGNTGGSPTLYQIPSTMGILGSSNLFTDLSSNASVAACSPVTDLPNPNTTGGSSERVFVSVQDNGRAAGCGAAGCLYNFVVTPWKPSIPYTVGQRILSSTLHIETVIQAGTSSASPPIWTNGAGLTVTDNNVTWLDQGALHSVLPAQWTVLHAYAAGSRIVDSNNNVEVVTLTGSGVSGASQPGWSMTPGATTSDGLVGTAVTWTNAGPIATFSFPAAGGTSGIIEDNVAAPGVLPGVSQVYFTTLQDQSCGSTGTGGCAVQVSQPGLQ